MIARLQFVALSFRRDRSALWFSAADMDGTYFIIGICIGEVVS